MGFQDGAERQEGQKARKGLRKLPDLTGSSFWEARKISTHRPRRALGETAQIVLREGGPRQVAEPGACRELLGEVRKPLKDLRGPMRDRR